MPAEPCCDVAMAERAVGGITYRAEGEGWWRVVYEGRPSPYTVQYRREGGMTAWVTMADGLEIIDTSGYAIALGYRYLCDFEKWFIATLEELIAEREGGSPPADTGGDLFPT